MLLTSRTRVVVALLLSLSVSFVTADAFTSLHSVAVLPYRANNKAPILRESNNINENDDVSSSSSAEDIPRGGADVNKAPPSLPTFATYRRFAIPCLGLWVAQPLLSLVDTAFVGLSSVAGESAQNLAALGPATTFFDGATYLFAFLNVATTNLYSSARAQRGEESDQAESVVRTAAKVSLNCGLGLMFFLWAFARPLLNLYIGHEATASPALLDAAVDYVKIRAFSMPTSLLLGVVQSACLGAQDSVTPLIAILYSTITNVIGDYILVKHFKMGLRGAAIATLFAQWAATAALLGPARKRLLRDRNFGLYQKKKVTAESTGGRQFLGFAAPVLTLILGKLAAFGFMTHAAAAVPGQPTPLASHQIILSLFFFVSPFLEVISQTAQTFIPPYLAPITDYVAKCKKQNPKYDAGADPTAKPWEAAAFSCANSLMKIGFGSAIVVASLASLVPGFFGGMLTSDATVKEAVKPLAKYLWAGAFLTAPVAVSEGVLLARRELKFLASVYLVSTALLPSALLRVKHVGGNVEQVWACFAVFQLFRATCFAGRIWSGPVLKRFGELLGGPKAKQADAKS